jgi:NarL family two-component system response regulator LiaR
VLSSLGVPEDDSELPAELPLQLVDLLPLDPFHPLVRLLTVLEPFLGGLDREEAEPSAGLEGAIEQPCEVPQRLVMRPPTVEVGEAGCHRCVLTSSTQKSVFLGRPSVEVHFRPAAERLCHRVRVTRRVHRTARRVTPERVDSYPRRVTRIHPPGSLDRLGTAGGERYGRGMGEERSPNGRQGRPLRAVIADDDALARRMVRDVLERAGISVVAEAHDGREAVELVRYHRPDIALLDVIMPHLDGIAATRRIVADIPGQVVILLTHSEDEDLGVLGLRAGATGYLSKEVDLQALPRALEGALAGEAAISRSMAKRIIEQLRLQPERGRGLRPVESPLTSREWQVLDLLCEQRTTEQIAETLVLSQETVRTHVKRILRKLGVKSRREAVEVADRLRLGPG